MIFADALDGVRGQAVLLREVPQPAILVSAQPPFGADPERAVLVLQQAADQVAQQAIGFGETREPPVFEPRHPVSLTANPEAAVAARAQRRDPAPAQLPRRILAQRHKAHTVEARQPLARPHPQIAVGSLRNRIDRVLRQPVIRLPGANAVRHDGIGGDRPGRCARRQEQQPGQQRQPLSRGTRIASGELHQAATAAYCQSPTDKADSSRPDAGVASG